MVCRTMYSWSARCAPAECSRYLNGNTQEGKGGVERSRGEVSYRESFPQENSLFWRVGEILVGNRESIDFCTPINHYYWNVPEGMRRMNQLHTHTHTQCQTFSLFFFFLEREKGNKDRRKVEREREQKQKEKEEKKGKKGMNELWKQFIIPFTYIMN